MGEVKLQRRGRRRGQAGYQDVVGPGGQRREDAPDLLQALAGAEYHFGETLAELAVMVHPGEPQVFEGQGPEAVHGRGHRQAAALNLLQQLLQNFAIHGSFLNRDRRESQI